jgi:hypothetical protein
MEVCKFRKNNYELFWMPFNFNSCSEYAHELSGTYIAQNQSSGSAPTEKLHQKYPKESKFIHSMKLQFNLD